MPDYETVIKGLECLAQKQEPMANPCSKCDYHERQNFAFCVVDVATDALALLKEQEAVKPIKMQRMDGNFSFFVQYFLCGNCRYELVGKDVMFCSHCGRSVKWE